MSKEKKVIELIDEQLEKVTGGNGSDNPKGLFPGDTVCFFHQEPAAWIWGTFESYNGASYIISWKQTTIFYGTGSSYFMEAGSASFDESAIK